MLLHEWKGVRPASEKIVTREELAQRVALWKQEGKRLVFTNGCFDLLHVGHLHYLQKARGMGDLLIVGVNTDESVRQLKGEGRPVVPEQERAELVAGLECVDYVVLFGEPTAEALLRLIQPDYYVKGGDYTERNLPEAELVVEQGGFVVILPYEEGYSTSTLLQRIRAERQP